MKENNILIEDLKTCYNLIDKFFFSFCLFIIIKILAYFILVLGIVIFPLSHIIYGSKEAVRMLKVILEIFE